MPLPKQSNSAFVVTGAGRGLGAAIAEEAAELGYPVALIARTKSDLEKVQSEVEKQGIKCSIHVCDLSSEESVASAFKEISDQHGSIRALVNNAATWTGGVSVEDLSTNDLKKSLDLNFFSAFYPIKETLKIWRSGRQEDLCIINIGATASKRGGANMSPFALAKSSLRILSESMARELGKDGVHVGHLIIDGLIDNERTRNLNKNASDDSFIPPGNFAKSILSVVEQDRSCWTFEWEVRPYNEKW